MFCLAAPMAHAVPVLWTLTDVEFLDGGVATGSFTYDADTSSFSGISITTSGGTSPGALYADLLSGNANDAAFMPNAALPDLTGEPLLQLLFQQPLTNAGGNVELTFINPAFSSFELSCTNAGCSSGSVTRVMATGGVVGTLATLPLPGGLALLASALFALGWRRRAA